MKQHQLKSWILEFREIKNYNYLVDSWMNFNLVGPLTYIFLHQERFIKLFDSKTLSILISHDSSGSTSNQYLNLTIKNTNIVLFVVVLISCINNKKIVERKNIYLMEFFPIYTNYIGSIKETLEKYFWSSNSNRLIVSLLYIPKIKNIFESRFLDPQESTWIIPINKKCIINESNQISCLWRKHIVKKKKNYSYHISNIYNEIIAGIEISFKYKYSKYRREFIFLYYMDYMIHKIINFNLGQLFEILGKDFICYIMSVFIECKKAPIQLDISLKQQAVGTTIQLIQLNDIEHVSNIFLIFSKKQWVIYLQNYAQFHMWQFFQDIFISCCNNQHESDFLINDSRENWIWLLNKYPSFFSKIQNPLSNIKYDSTRYIFVQVTDFQQCKVYYSDKYKDPFYSFINYKIDIHKLKIKDRSIIFDPYFIQTEQTDIESDILQKCLFVYYYMSWLFMELDKRINNYLITEVIKEFIGNTTISIFYFLSDKWSELNRVSNIISNIIYKLIIYYKFLKKETYFSFVPSRRAKNKEMVYIFKIIMYLQDTILIHTSEPDHICDLVPKYELKSEYRLLEMLDLLTISTITEPYLVFHMEFSFYFYIDSYKLYQKIVFNKVLNSRDELKKTYLWVLPTIFYLFRVYFGNKLNVTEAVNKYRLIQNLIKIQFKIQYSTYVYIINIFNRFILMNRSDCNLKYLIQMLNDTFNHILNNITIMKYMNYMNIINQHLLNLKNNHKKWFDTLIFRTDIFMNRDSDSYNYSYNLYRYKRSNGINKFYKYFVYEQNNPLKIVQVVFLWFLCINKYFIYWSEAIDKEYLYKPLFLVLSKSLLFLFVIIGNISINKLEIHIYEFKYKDPNYKLCNKLLEYIDVQIINFNKFKDLLFLLDYHDTLQRSKLLIFINVGTILSFLFKNISKRLIYSFNTINKKNRRKSCYSTYSYLSMIYNYQYNWFNPIKPFHISSLISYFYKENQFIFLNDSHNLWLYCHKRFHFDFYVKKTYIKNYIIHSISYRFRSWGTHKSICNKIFYLYVDKKKDIQKESDILITNDFTHNVYEKYKLYKYLSFKIRYEPFVRGTIYFITDIYARPITEEQIVNLEKYYYQLISYMNLYYSERNNLNQYLSLNSNMGLINTLCSYKYLSSGNNKNLSFCLNKCVYKGQMYRTFSPFSNLSKCNLFQTYMPWFLTSIGCQYLNFTLLDILSDPLPMPIFISSQKFVSIFNDMMHESYISRLIYHKIIPKWTLISYISSQCLRCLRLQNILLSEEMIHKNNESPVTLIWSHMRSPNAWEFLYSIIFLLIVAGYIIHRHIIFFSRVYSELQTELEHIKYLMIPSYMIGFKEILNRYPTSELNPLWLKNIFIVVMEELRSYASGGNMLLGGGPTYGIKSLKSLCSKINLIYIGSIIPNPLNKIIFSINTRYLSRTSKDIYSFIRKIKNVNGYWIDDKIELWVAKSYSIDDEEREFLFQFFNLTTEKSISQIIWSLTHSDNLSKNDSGYKMIEQPGSISLRYLVDIHQKYLMNYEFNKSCLAERRIFLAHYNTILYSQTPRWTNSFQSSLSPNEKPFSLKLSLYPYIGILLIGYIEIGRYNLVKDLVKNSYVPLITIFPNKFLDDNPNYYIIDDSDDDLDIYIDKDMYMTKKIDQFDITLQFELAKAMSPCIIWIPNIHDLHVNESNYLSLGLLDNYIYRDFERCSTSNILVIASTHIPQKVDPALITPNKLNTCIKIRRLLLQQQKKHFLILLYTRGFQLEKNMFHTKGFESINLGYNVRDIVKLINESLSISITQNKFIIESNTIISALYRKTWNFRSHIRLIQGHGILFYQIGRAVTQNVLISNCPIDPISIYMNKKSCKGGDSYLYKWYFKLGMIMNKLTILLYLLSCSAGLVAQDLWYSSRYDEKNWITSYGFVDNDSYIVHGLLILLLLLEVEGALAMVVSSRTDKYCSQFDKNPVALLLRFEPSNQLDMMQNESCPIVNQRFKYEKYELEFEEGEGVLDLQQIEEDLFNHIFLAPRIWCPCGNLFDCIEGFTEFIFPYWTGSFRDKWIIYHKENDSELLNSGTMQYQTLDKYSKEQSFFRTSQYILDLADPLFSLLKDKPSVFSFRELFADEEMSKGLIASQKNTPTSIYKRWFIKNTQEKHLKVLIHRQKRCFRTNSSLSNGSFRSNTLSESYQYLSNLFLYNETLLNKIKETLLRNRWLFPDEIKY
uniref:Protein Ycf2 n=1 Tax=Yoania squamipes TaxID=2876154 RepID=A0A9E7V896_9ASPA|nr:hypothetical chloroplast RF21 [Yoania squamipes]UZA66562.1 hypothetical chloroplast RF21 [Yoania squamipes]